jgi:hypothetical protein
MKRLSIEFYFTAAKFGAYGEIWSIAFFITRTMCRITIAHAIRHRLSSASLFKRLAMEPFDTYYNRRLRRWTGHVARMPLTRAPRKFLACWVENPPLPPYLAGAHR